MSLANCKHCGQLYVQHKSAYCHECRRLHDGYYKTMRDYLKAHPRSTLLDIHEHTGIPLAKVLEMRNETYVPFGQ